MAKIAAELESALARRAESGGTGNPKARVIAQGDGWTVADVVCTAGPQDRPFEEQHARFAIAVVVAGSFQYRSHSGRELMTAGSVLLGNAGQYFECGHEHGAGDRCISFQYDADYFESLAGNGGEVRFSSLRLPPLRALSPLLARAYAGLAGSGDMRWEELSLALAAQAAQLAGRSPGTANSVSAGALARVTQTLRRIERQLDGNLTIRGLAKEARLSPFHFLRTFECLTGVTPHQYILRLRLREAAMRLVSERAKILDVALDCGFGDVSNFNRAFRAEFGVSPREYRGQA